MEYYVYEILIDGDVRYIGYTNNIHKRQLQHRRDLKNFNGKGKYFYKMIRERGLEDVKITLNEIYKYDNKFDAMRMECKLILDYYFSTKQLWQSIPFGFKYF